MNRKALILFISIIQITFMLNVGLAASYSPDVKPSPGTMIFPCNFPIELTSAYGWRVHPIFGDVRYHSGVDLAGDFYDPIYAIYDGVVYSAGYNGGFGLCIEVDHGGGLFSLYGHCMELNVTPGEYVRQGQVIGRVGSSGYSTGPHIHLSMFENEWSGLVDPGIYIPGLSQLEENYGTLEYDGSSTVGTDYNLDKVDPMQVTSDFAKPLKDFVDTFAEVFTKAIGLMKDYVLWLFAMLAIIDLAASAMFYSLGAWNEDSGHNFSSWYIYKVVYYATMVLLISNWAEIVGGIALNGFPALGSLVAGSDLETTGKMLSDPSMIVQKGMHIVANLLIEVQRSRFDSILSFFTTNAMTALCFIFGIILFICFCLIGIQIAKAFISFYIVIIFSFYNFFLSGLKHTSKYAANGLNGVFAASLSLMFWCIFSTIITGYMEKVEGDGLITSTYQQSQTTGTAGQKAEILSVDDLMTRIAKVDSHGGNYHCDKGDGTYGKYAINISQWDKWCNEYEKEGGFVEHDADGYKRYIYDGNPPNHGKDTYSEPAGTQFPWSPLNQDTITKHILLKIYSETGSWEETAKRWHSEISSNNSTGDAYVKSLLEKKGADKVERKLAITKVFQILCFVLLFVIMGDRLEKLIIKDFGGMGFKLTNEQ